jgi:hypothetical protein
LDADTLDILMIWIAWVAQPNQCWFGFCVVCWYLYLVFYPDAWVIKLTLFPMQNSPAKAGQDILKMYLLRFALLSKHIRI